MDIELIQVLVQLPMSAATLVGLLFIYTQQNKTVNAILEREAALEKQQQIDAKAERERAAELAEAERKRVAERDDKMLDLYSQHVASEAKLVAAIDGNRAVVTSMLEIEKQNQDILLKANDLLEALGIAQQNNRTALQTLTGSMDSFIKSFSEVRQDITNIVTAVDALKSEVSEGNGDHKRITDSIEKVSAHLMAKLDSIEAALKPRPPNRPPPRAEKPAIVARDDEEKAA